MSQTETAKAVVAEERTEETRSFMRMVKAASRRKYTPEEKIRIVLEGFRREVTVSDLRRREGIKPHSYYAWAKEFMEAGRERFSRPSPSPLMAYASRACSMVFRPPGLSFFVAMARARRLPTRTTSFLPRVIAV